jgi:hypothetical protein
MQRIAIDSLQSIIKQKESIIQSLKEEHLKTLTEIALNNSKAQETTVVVDDISDNQLKKERKRFLGLHFYAGVEVPRLFEFKELGFNTELMYELERFEFGIKGAVFPITINNSTNYEFNYFLKIRYKFF